MECSLTLKATTPRECDGAPVCVVMKGEVKITENKKEFFTGKKISIAKKSEAKTGKAYLRSSISGKSKDYSIEIEKVFFHEKNSLKTLKIRVTDPN